MVRDVETVVARGDPVPRESVERCSGVLRENGLLAHPTSTVYGIGARATPELDAEISRLKGRPETRPLLRLAPGVAALRELRPELRWDERAERLARRFWPGPLTLVLEDGTESGLGVRVDSHPVIGAVLDEFGELMSSTSLNRSGEEPARDAARGRSILRSWPETERRCVLADAGPLPPSQPSTVLSLREEPPRILRRGSVAARRIRAVLSPRDEE